MKKSQLFALASGLLFLGSCASDAPDVTTPATADSDGVGYMRIEFADPATRVETAAGAPGTLVNATADESSISNATFVFYAADGTDFSVKVKSDLAADATDVASADEGYWVKGEGHSNCAIVKLKKMPVAVACVINHPDASTYSGDLNNTSYKVSKFAKDETNQKNFYMSSSKYYDEENGNATKYKTDIEADQLFKTFADAKTVTAKSVKICVDRYVAKVQIKSTVTLDATAKTVDPESGGKDFVNGKITFKPEYAFLTATEDDAYTIKKIPANYTNDNAEWLHDLSGFNSPSTCQSGIVSPTSGNINYPTLESIAKTEYKYPTGSDYIKYYAYENNRTKSVEQTSVVVVGTYSVTDDAGKSLAADDGTFYLVAFEDKFTVYKTEQDAVKAMGGDDGDVLTPDYGTATGTDAFKSWGGWMKIAGKNLVTRCVKCHEGKAYYAKQICRFKGSGATDYLNAIVRNHLYDVTITDIKGIGVGIPSEDHPIIPIPGPDPKDQNYYLHMSVTVNPWVTVTNNVSWN